MREFSWMGEMGGKWGQAAVCCALLAAGCMAPNQPPPPPAEPLPPNAPEVQAAERLFEQGKLQDSIIACVDIARKNPEARGLADLQTRITTQLAENRLKETKDRSSMLNKMQTADAQRFSISPETYRQQKHVVGENTPLRSAPTAMQQVLKKPVTIHLVNADLSALVAQIGQSQNVNIISDSSLADLAQTLTVHVEGTPLCEVLEYIGRNLSVNFSVGENIIWVTPKEEQTTGLPLETRMYRLRKGMIGSELGRYPYGKTIFKGAEERGQSRSSEEIKEGDAKEGKIGILDIIERFVPQPEGADFLFNDKAHMLVAKNTRENLDLIEEIIEKLDIRPLQVLIEARFVTTNVNDFKKLGIDWLIDNRGGSRFNTTAYGENTLPSSAQFSHDALAGTITEAITDGNGAASGGLSMGYQFLLGDTALQAVLHALDQTGESQTLAVPRVTTLNNREARFRIGEDIVYFEEVDADTSTSTGYGSGNNVIETTFDWETPMTLEVGYSLTVTPSVGADLSAINLVLRPEISSVKEWKKYQVTAPKDANNHVVIDENMPAIQVPTVSRQYIETETTVRSGETVILGGLVDSSKKEAESNTPWFSTLPLIGRLFKTEEKNATTKNVLVFVTATLISDVGESLIPLNEFERYGAPVKKEDAVPDVLKSAKPAGVPAALPAAPPVAKPVPVKQ